MQGIRGKRVLITGGSTGIGKATALRLAAEGASVAVNYLDDPAPAEAVVQETQQLANSGGNAFAVQGDVGDESSVAAMLAQVFEHFGGIDVLVNNAGIQSPKRSHEMSTEEWDRVIRVNLRGVFLCCRGVLAHWVPSNGGGATANVLSPQRRRPVNDCQHLLAHKSMGLHRLSPFEVTILNRKSNIFKKLIKHSWRHKPLRPVKCKHHAGIISSNCMVVQIDIYINKYCRIAIC